MTATTSTHINQDGDLVVACSTPVPAGWTDADIKELEGLVTARLVEALGSGFLFGAEGCAP